MIKRFGNGAYVYFDSEKIVKEVDAKTRKALSKFGAFTAQTAKRSIRKRKKASKPGNPPHSHEGSLKRLIRFAYDRSRKSVVVGPLPAYQGKAPAALEYGGRVRFKNPLRVDRKIGDGGAFRYVGKSSLNKRSYRKRSGRDANEVGFEKTVTDRFGRKRRVAFAKLETKAQVKRAEEFEEELWGPKIVKSYLKTRPFMGPAFQKNLPVAEALFAPTQP